MRSSSLNIMLSLFSTLNQYGMTSWIMPRPLFDVDKAGLNLRVISTAGLLSPKTFELDVILMLLSGISTGKNVIGEPVMEDSTVPEQSEELYELTRIELMVIADQGF